MANEDTTEKNGNARLIALVIAVLGAFGGGFGSNYLWLRANPESLAEMVRPDPFTGTAGRELERQIDNVGSDLRELSNRIDRMDPEEVSNRLNLIEHEIDSIKKRLQGKQL